MRQRERRADMWMALPVIRLGLGLGSRSVLGHSLCSLHLGPKMIARGALACAHGAWCRICCMKYDWTMEGPQKGGRVRLW